ncbi:MAG: hypothetical protein Q8P45_03445 [Candidatus Harrisonbacteria bacterium]|nr:hypothetical protein [Candidatus Harrisonbacteria bacterium]
MKKKYAIGEMAPATISRYGAENGYGFMKLGDGSSLFFHIKGFRWPVVDEGRVLFSASQRRPGALGESEEMIRRPQKGDRVVVRIAAGRPGSNCDKAQPWCFAEQWERAEKAIASRYGIYRVLLTVAVGLSPDKMHSFEEILFEGSKVGVLDTYPLSARPDPLSFGCEDGRVSVEISFHYRAGGSSEWKTIADPRLAKLRERIA